MDVLCLAKIEEVSNMKIRILHRGAFIVLNHAEQVGRQIEIACTFDWKAMQEG
jgi:hypothetical protein